MSDGWRFAIIAVGAALILGAVLWRYVRSQRGSQQLSRALRDPDPLVRRAAIEVMSERGIGDYAPALRPLINSEPDANVLDALALAITRNQWEPADNRKLVELRLWAKARNEANPPEPTLVPPAPAPAPVVAPEPPVTPVSEEPAPEPIPSDVTVVTPTPLVAPVPVVAQRSAVVADAQREADDIIARAQATARSIEAAARAERIAVLEQTYAEVAAIVASARDGQSAVLADARALLERFMAGDGQLPEEPLIARRGTVEIHHVATEEPVEPDHSSVNSDDDDDDDEDGDVDNDDNEQKVVIVIRSEQAPKKKKKK